MTAPTFVAQGSVSGQAIFYPGITTVVYGDWGPFHAQDFETLSWGAGTHYGGGPNDTVEYFVGSSFTVVGGISYWTGGQARERQTQVVSSPGGFVPVSGMAVAGAVGAAAGDLVVMVVTYSDGASVPAAGGFQLVGKSTPSPQMLRGMAVFRRTVVSPEPANYQVTFSPPLNGDAHVAWYAYHQAGQAVEAVFAEMAAANPWATPALAGASPDNALLCAWDGVPISSGIVGTPAGMGHPINMSNAFVADESTVGNPSLSRSLVLLSPYARGIAATIAIPPFNTAPLKPRFLTPGPGGAVDMTRPWQLVFQSTDPNGASDPPSAVRVKATNVVSGISVWWNGTDWAATTEQTVLASAAGAQTHFSGELIAVDVQALAFTQADWTFQAATRDQALLWGPYGDAALVHGVATPGVRLVAPPLIVDDRTAPLLVWDAPTQSRFTTRIWPAAAVTGIGPTLFNPDTTPALAGSATLVLSDQRQWASPVELSNNADYYAGVQVAESHGVKSDWSLQPFRIQVSAPAEPLESGTWDNTNARVILDLTLTDNLLSGPEATMDTDTAWQPVDNAVVASVANSDAVHGAKALSVTSPAAGPSSVVVARLLPIAALKLYSAGIAAWTAGVPGSGRIIIDQFDSRPLFISSIEIPFSEGTATVAGSGDVGVVSAFPAVFGVAGSVAPHAADPGVVAGQFTTAANAVYVQFRVQFDSSAAGQVHFLDAAVLRRGPDGTFRIGGLVDASRLTVYRSDDGGETFSPVRNGALVPDSNGDARLYDYEATPGVLAQYRGQAIATIGSLDIAGLTTTVDVLIAQTRPWVKAPTQPALNVPIVRLKLVNRQRRHRIVEQQPPFRDDPIMVSTGWGKNRGSVSAYVGNPDDEDALETLLTSDLVLLVQEPPDYGTTRGRQRYVTVGAQLDVSMQFQKRYPDRGLTVPYVEVIAP